MKINIQPSLQTAFKDFFTNISDNSEIQELIVPIYQREYDWEEERIIRMLSDLDYYLEDQKTGSDEVDVYFLGAVILERNSKDKRIFEVVDGQQRLTTFYLLNYLNYLTANFRFRNPDVIGMKPYTIGKLIGKLEEIYKDCERRLVSGTFEDKLLEEERKENGEPPANLIRRISNNYLFNSADRDQKFRIRDKEINLKLEEVLIESELVLSDNDIKLKTNTQENPYGENLTTIFDYLYSKFKVDNDNLDKVLKSIQEQIYLYLRYAGMALIISENKDDSFKLFEVLNDTARKLTVLDLMKNYFVEHLKDDYNKNDWRALKNEEQKIKRVNLITDVIKSEGYAKSTYEYSYLSNKIKERPDYYREKESAIEYFARIRNIARILGYVTNNQFYKSNVFNNSLSFNIIGIDSVKFHWGRQVMMAYLNLSNIYKKEDIIKSDIWNDFDPSTYTKLSNLHKFYLISSDLLFKIGIVGKINNLSSKVLPETGKRFLKQYHRILNQDKIVDADIIELTEDLKAISLKYLNEQSEKFNNNLNLLNYQNNTHKTSIKHLLYIVYNKGKNGSYSLNDLSLEHIEPQTEKGEGYFQHEDRIRIVNSLGNIILLGSSDNSSFGNLKVKQKIEKSSEYKNDAFISHRGCKLNSV